ncbi:MAG: hypothetical protein ACK5HT_08705 [Draconibacterium sp.]
MNLKNKLRFTKSLVIVAGLAIISICGVLFQGCSKEDAIETDDKVTKKEILKLANKYGIPIEFTEIKGSNDQSIPTLEELDKIFASYKKCREESFEKTLKRTKNGERIVFQTKRKIRNSGILRLKSGDVEGGMWSEDAWYYDLTWLDVDVSWQDTGDALNINVSSSYNGVSLYQYVQDNFSYSTSGDTIYFNVTGTQSMTIGFDNFGIHFTDDVNASGWVNTSTGEGSLTIDKSDYWF